MLKKMKAAKKNIQDSIPVNIFKHKEQSTIRPRLAMSFIGNSKIENSRNGGRGGGGNHNHVH